MLSGALLKRMTSGKFITFEGGEGAGKSTQIKLLKTALETANIPVIATREPGGSSGAETIRNLLLNPEKDWDTPTETLLHFAARADHFTTRIAPALKNGDCVLCDRFADSTRAYQGYGLGLDIKAIEILYELTLGEFKPDLTLILDIPVQIGTMRLQDRGEATDRYEQMDSAFHQRLREGFLDIAKNEPERCVVIDATADIDTIASIIKNCVANRLGLSLFK